MVEFQAISWEARDVAHGYRISIFGRTEKGESVCATTAFKPYFFIKLNSLKLPVIQDFLEETLNSDTHIYSKMIASISLVEGKDLMGFHNNATFKFAKITFYNHGDFKYVASLCHRKWSGGVYEANIDPFLRLMHRTGIKSTGWLRAEGKRHGGSHCDIDIMVKDWATLTPLDRDDISPVKILSFDIETNSSTGKFPDPKVAGDAIFQIAMTTRIHGSRDIVDKVCLCSQPTEGPDIICYDGEKALLEGFRDKMIEMDPDLVTGYNIFGFDLEYIWTRAVYRRCHDRFYALGKLKNVSSEYVTKRLSSNALGDNTLKMVPMSGRYIFDVFHEVKRAKMLDSYSLNSVSKLFLGEEKIDMSAHEMFARYARGDPQELGEVAKYCIQDTLLPLKLIDRLSIISDLVEMAKATWVPLSYLSERAQQIKVFSQLTRKARDLGFFVPTIKKKYDPNRPPEKYEGATVLEPDKGAYYQPVTALDFASLYPSIMMAHNLCYSTMVNPGSKYDNIPGITYEEFPVGDKVYRFAQDVPSLLPIVLAELKEFRKKAKKLMAQHSGTPMEEIYNSQQLAYKVSMNSIYGFCGASVGMLPMVPIAATVTSQGRRMIDMTKKHVEENFPGARVRYGDTDSVMVQFDTTGMDTETAIVESWKLGEEAAEACNSLFKKPNDLELEKVYCPYILYSKKRYAANMWIQDRQGNMKMDKMDVKGLQLVRRDNTPYAREVCKEILELILSSQDPEPAINLALKRAEALINGEVPMEKLIMSKSLASHYKVRGEKDWKYSAGGNCPLPSLPHVQVLEKIRDRTPGAEPHPGNRVPFVLIKTDDDRAKVFEKAEDPTWVASHPELQLDYLHYFTNQLKKPIEDLLDPLIQGREIFAALMPPKPPRRKKGDTVKSRDLRDMFKEYAGNNTK